MENKEVSSTQKLNKAEKAAAKLAASEAKIETRRVALLAKIKLRCELLEIPMLDTVECSNEALEVLLKNLKRYADIYVADAAEKLAEGAREEVTPDSAVADEMQAAIIRANAEDGEQPEEISPTLPQDAPPVIVPAAPAPAEVNPERVLMLAACVAAIRADKKIGIGSNSLVDLMTDEELTAHLNKSTRGRNCSPAGAVSYYKIAQKKAADGQAAA